MIKLYFSPDFFVRVEKYLLLHYLPRIQTVNFAQIMKIENLKR